MNRTTVFVLILGGLAYALYAVPAIRQFFAYCDLVAAATSRSAENADSLTQDDGGINAFQREQYRLLRSGEFMNSEDAAVVARGMVVAHKIKVMFWAAVVLVVACAASDIWAW